MQLPPEVVGPIAIYRQPEPPRRSRRSLASDDPRVGCDGRSSSPSSGIAGGAYLYLHETVAAVAPKSVDVKVTARRLDLPVAGQPATALVIGYDRRADEGKNAPSRSDTLMLVRANPKNDTISLLSFPRDLRTELVCPGGSSSTGKINAAYANCGAKGALETVRKLTGVPINYLITVNFTGFRQLVDKLGGIWMDVDRRYLNTQERPERLRDDQPSARLSAARRLSGARLRALPAHRQRPLPQRPSAALRPVAEGSGADELLTAGSCRR